MIENFSELFNMMEEAQKYVIVEHDIEYPLEIHGVRKMGGHGAFGCEKVGSFVSIRPVNEKYKNKTFLGLYLGDFILENRILFDKRDNILNVFPNRNPAIFVFDLNKVIWGYESWWGVIESEDDLKQITDVDIENIWYVKALKALTKGADDVKTG